MTNAIEFRRILCPVDFSDASRHALEHAVAVAKWYEAPIVALHVAYPVLLYPPPIPFAGGPQPPSVTEADRRSLEERLAAWLEPAKQAGLKTEAVFDEGTAASRILDHARTDGADLIVMGTHGLSGFERFILGSVTEKVLRKAGCPVLTVPPAVTTAAKVPYRRLLCPVDFSESSLSALGAAVSLAEESDAHLIILHVFDWPPEGDADNVLVERFDVPQFRRAVEEQVQARLQALVTPEMRVWCKPATKVAHGKPYRRILETAETEAADLIIIGIRGRNPVDLALFGSTTNHVVRSAACPVLTLRP